MPKSIFRRLSKKFFIISNVAVALLFLAGCYNKFIFSDSLWPVGLLTVGAFYLLLLLFFFFVFWLFIKPGWVFISLAAVALAADPLQNMIPFRFSSSFDQQKTDSSLRIMSWNVSQFDVLVNKKRPQVRDAMIDLVNEYQPDITCFQEMVAADTLYNLNDPYYRKYSFYSVYEFMEKLHFPDYHYSYNYKENFMKGQHFGLIMFSKYPIINKQKISYYPFTYNESFQFADIVKGADTIRVFNIHLQTLDFTTENLKYIDSPTIDSKSAIEKTKNIMGKFKYAFAKRKAQAERIRKTIEESPYPVVVCGDFNDVPNSYAYSTIGKNLQDAFAEKGSGLGRSFNGISPTLRIDNIFVDQEYEVKQFKRVKKALSDHFPIIADISKKKAG